MGKRRDTRPYVLMLGARGCPDVQGGIEKHVEALAPRLAAQGFRVEVIGRRPYLSGGPRSWEGVEITPLWSPRSKALETIVHSTLAVLLAGLRRPDLVHFHGIGPALLAPLARVMGLRVVVTHHGYNYQHVKWGRFARTMLQLGERFGMLAAHLRIAVSANIADTLQARYRRQTHYVPNGVVVNRTPPDSQVLDSYGLGPEGYVLTVSRLVPEKRQLDLIAAYAQLENPAYKLVIVGGADHPDDYERSVIAAAATTRGVVMTGFLSGAKLASLFAHAGVFVLPSSHEGMPIALLEALSYGLPVLASDIEANLALGLPEERYFPLGDVTAMAAAIDARMAQLPGDAEREAQIADVAERYGWAAIADATVALYVSALPRDRQPATASYTAAGNVG